MSECILPEDPEERALVFLSTLPPMPDRVVELYAPALRRAAQRGVRLYDFGAFMRAAGVATGPRWNFKPEEDQ